PPWTANSGNKAGVQLALLDILVFARRRDRSPALHVEHPDADHGQHACAYDAGAVEIGLVLRQAHEMGQAEVQLHYREETHQAEDRQQQPAFGIQSGQATEHEGHRQEGSEGDAMGSGRAMGRTEQYPAHYITHDDGVGDKSQPDRYAQQCTTLAGEKAAILGAEQFPADVGAPIPGAQGGNQGSDQQQGEKGPGPTLYIVMDMGPGSAGGVE